MNDILKQRLVGALILLALGVVFWPIIFMPEGERQVAGQPPIPPPPSIATEPIATPELDGLRNSPTLNATMETEGTAGVSLQEPVEVSPVDASPDEPTAAAGVTPIADEQPARQAPPPQLKMDSDGVPIAWTLQVATVSAREKAEALRAKLLGMNQKAYITQLSSGGKTLYRVSIGPKFERAELEKLQSRINTEFGVTTMVVRYHP